MKNIMKIFKENNEVFIEDNDGCKVNIDGNYETQQYEKNNKVQIEDLLIKFLEKIDNNSEYKKKGFDEIIKDINDLVKQNNIDYFVYGVSGGESKDTICITFNLKNRLSTINCELEIFYSLINEKEGLSIQISFNNGSGSSYGYDLYKYFDYIYYIRYLRPILQKYFESKEDKKVEKELLQYFISDIINHVDNYYDE